MVRCAVRVPDELVAFIEGGTVACWAATVDATCCPEPVRVMGARVGASRTSLTVWMPTAQLGRTLENLARGAEPAGGTRPPWLAVIFCRVIDYSSLQVKGEVEEVRPALESERPRLDAYGEAFADACAQARMARALAAAMVHWPATAITVSVRELFLQTPGPDAGAPWPA